MAGTRIRTLAVTLALAFAVAGAPHGALAADLYITGNMLASDATGDAKAETQFFDTKGSDSDDSAAWGASAGLGFELYELNPRGWGQMMPEWDVRLELEGLAGRSYEFVTGNNFSRFVSDVDAWSLTFNTFVDVPIHPLVSRWTGRLPVIEPLGIYTGGGLGYARVDVKTSDNVTSGRSNDDNFAWHVSTGLFYKLTRRVNVTAGYRYEDLGQVNSRLKIPPGQNIGKSKIDLTAHTFTSAVRIDFYTAPLEDLSPTRWPTPSFRRPGWLPTWLGGRPRP